MDKLTELSHWKEKSRNWLRDNLTGLYNRKFYDETIKREVASSQRYKQPLSLIVLDVDHFKDINDGLGHQVGDKVLKDLGRLFNENTRETDFPCRYGGDEIVLILPQTRLHDEKEEANGAYKMAERLRELVERKIMSGNRSVTVSIGVAQWQEGNSPGDLFNRADKALYQAKEEGRNKVRVAD